MAKDAVPKKASKKKQQQQESQRIPSLLDAVVFLLFGVLMANLCACIVPTLVAGSGLVVIIWPLAKMHLYSAFFMVFYVSPIPGRRDG
jgi:hypothetical protein